MSLSNSKFVVFRVGEEEYGIHIDQVISIERLQSITSIPNYPKHVAGVIDLRGVVTPVVDLRKALEKEDVQDNESTRIVVVNVEGVSIGLIVDAATDVMDIPNESIQKPNLTNHQYNSFLLGIAKVNERLLILLDVESLLQNITSLDKLKHLKQGMESTE